MPNSWPLVGLGATPRGNPITLKPIPVLQSSSVTSGRPKVRPLRSKTDVLYSGVVFMTGTEKDTFDTWYVDTLLNGSLSFEWTHPLTGSTVEMAFEPDSPPEFTNVTGNSDPTAVVYSMSFTVRIFAT